MAREGEVLTRTLKVESRQHELFGYDLGEGPVRGALLFGGALMVLWSAFLLLLLGFPNKYESPFFIVPPIMVAFYGWQEDPNNPRRRIITSWVLAGRNVLRGQRAVITLGRRAERPNDNASPLKRLAVRFSAGDPWALLFPWRVPARFGYVPDPTDASRLDPITFESRVQHYGIDAAMAFTDERNQRIERKQNRRPRRAAPTGASAQ